MTECSGIIRDRSENVSSFGFSTNRTMRRFHIGLHNSKFGNLRSGYRFSSERDVRAGTNVLM